MHLCPCALKTDPSRMKLLWGQRWDPPSSFCESLPIWVVLQLTSPPSHDTADENEFFRASIRHLCQAAGG